MLRILLAVVLVLVSGSAEAAAKRAALVMAADRYELLRPLDNAVNDARAIEAALDALGFEVTLEENRNLRRMRRALEDFAEDAEGAEVALVFFAGHGIEIAGENRLLPVDADPASLEALKASTLPLEAVREAIAGVAPVGLIVLDACRDDPFAGASSGQAGGRGAKSLQPQVQAVVKPGLGRIGRAENILFAFSAAPGQTAADGADGNSPFTAAVTKYLGTEGLEIRSVLTLVQQEVYDRSRGRQLPYVESGLPKLFFASAGPGDLPERERLLLAMADISPRLRSEVERIAAERDVPLAPLFGALIASDAANLDDAQRSAKLRLAADAFVRVRSEMRMLSADDPQVAALRREAEADLALGAFETARSKLDQAVELDGESLDALKANVVTRTVSKATSLYLIGGTEAAQGKLAEALGQYRAAAALFEDIAPSAMTEQAAERQMLVLEAIATTEIAQGAIGDALDSADRLRIAAEAAAGRDPEAAAWQKNLATAHTLTGQVWLQLGSAESALREFDAAHRFAGRAVELAPGDPGSLDALAAVLGRIGIARQAAGSLREALAAFTQQAAVLKQSVEAGSALPAVGRRLSSLYLDIGDLQMRLLQHASAHQAYDAAVALRRQALAADPDDPNARFELGAAMERVGNVLAAQGDLAGAEAAYQVRHAGIVELAEQHPEHMEIRRDLSVSHEKLGDLARLRKDLPAALAAYRRSQAVIDAMAAARPDNLAWQGDSAIIGRKVAEVMQESGDKPGALKVFQSALAISQALAAQEPANPAWQAELATGHNRVADVEFALGRKPEALAGYRRSLEIMQGLAAAGPSDPVLMWNLSLAYRQVAAMGDAPAQNLAKALEILDALQKQGLLDPANAGAPDAARKELAQAATAAK